MVLIKRGFYWTLERHIFFLSRGIILNSWKARQIANFTRLGFVFQPNSLKEECKIKQDLLKSARSLNQCKNVIHNQDVCTHARTLKACQKINISFHSGKLFKNSFWSRKCKGSIMFPPVYIFQNVAIQSLGSKFAERVHVSVILM